MKKTILLFMTMSAYFLFAAQLSSAQQGDDQLQKLLSVVKQQKQDYQEANTREGIRPLRNPFTPQLPKELPKPPEPPTPPDTRQITPPIEDPRGGQTYIQPIQPPDRETRTTKLQLPALDISGLIWNSDRPQAIINDEIIDVGDSIDDLTILAIRKSSIDVLFMGEKYTIFADSSTESQ